MKKNNKSKYQAEIRSREMGEKEAEEEKNKQTNKQTKKKKTKRKTLTCNRKENMRIDVQIQISKTWYEASFMDSWSDRLLVPGVFMLLETFNKSPASLIKCRCSGCYRSRMCCFRELKQKSFG